MPTKNKREPRIYYSHKKNTTLTIFSPQKLVIKWYVTISWNLLFWKMCQHLMRMWHIIRKPTLVNVIFLSSDKNKTTKTPHFYSSRTFWRDGERERERERESHWLFVVGSTRLRRRTTTTKNNTHLFLLSLSSPLIRNKIIPLQMGTFDTFRKAYGALKDSTKVGLAKVNSEFKVPTWIYTCIDRFLSLSFFCFSILFIKICFLCWKDLEIAVVKATNHVECPPKERHVRSEPFSFVFRVFMQEIFDIFENLDLYRTMLQITIWVGLVFFFFFFILFLPWFLDSNVKLGLCVSDCVKYKLNYKTKPFFISLHFLNKLWFNMVFDPKVLTSNLVSNY
jgi:hypothetical protein